MFSLEFKQSRGCLTETYYARDVIDMYTLFKDGQRIFSEKPDWEDYYLVLNIDNHHKEIWISKKATVYDFVTNDFYKGFYSTSENDYNSIKDDIYKYIIEIKEMLDIQDYKIKT